MEAIKIVVRYADGKILKGYTRDFFPNKVLFHLTAQEGDPSTGAVEVRLQDLKAVFFVRDFAGNPSYNERKKYLEEEKPQGKVVEVLFKDEEVMVGTILGYDPQRPGFFIFPADPKGNNMRVFAISKAVNKVRFL